MELSKDEQELAYEANMGGAYGTDREVAGNKEKKLAKGKECSVAELLMTGAENGGGGVRATFP